MENLIKKLALLKADNNLTFLDLSKILHVTEQTVKNYFSGRTAMPLDKVYALSSALNVDTSWLLSDDNGGRYMAKPVIMYEASAVYRSKSESAENSDQFNIIIEKLQELEGRIKLLEGNRGN